MGSLHDPHIASEFLNSLLMVAYSVDVKMEVNMSRLLTKMFSTRKSSLVTTITAFQIICALPEWSYFAIGLHSENKLSVSLAIYIAVLCVMANLFAGSLFWLTVVEPIRKRM